MYVKTVAIDPASTGTRLGTALVQRLRELAIDGNQRGILAVIAINPANKRSLALFKNSLGCQEIGRRYDDAKGISWGLFKSTLPSKDG